MFIWIVGSPRSGTTFLTNYIGKHTNYKYNEPWKTHPIETPRLWSFPKADTIVFKHCENWRNLHTLMNLYPNSVYVHVYRDPDNVVNSMAHPKENSNPPRNLYGGYSGDDRIRICMQRWYSNMMHCLSIYNIIPHQYVEISYENMPIGLKKLSEKTKIEFISKLDFDNRNDEIEMDWNLNKSAKRLRNLVKSFDGVCLAKWINKHRPNFLNRVVL